MRYVPKEIEAHYEKLSEAGQKTFRVQFRQKRRSMTTLYVAWLFFGVHYAVLGRWWSQLLFWVLGGGALLSSANFGLGKMGFAIASLWWAIDFFRVPFMVYKENAKVAYETLKEAKLMDTALHRE